MRPLILTMQAFGSYGQKVTIDFRETSQNLFLITGDTGAGKTTIFDAIVFALYGEASSGSNKKDGPVLQSQYMGYDSEPYVELTFSEGVSEDADIYTVKRIPTHMRLLTRGKDKGSKTREVSGSVSLIMPDGTEYSAKNTNARLEEIIGLTKKQFMQVAMIAQGEFMELLRAKTDTKKEIFRKLFNTELFERISAELGKREKEKSVVLSTIRTECQTNVARMKVPEEYEAKGELEQLGRQITEENSLANIEKYMEGLEKLCDELKNKKNCKAKEEKEAEQIRDGKRDIYAKSELLLKLFGQLEKAEKDIADCKMQESIINELEELNKRLRLAYEIKVEYDKYIDAEKVLYEIKTELKNQTDLLPVLTANMEEASCKEIHAKEEYEKENKSYIRISERVETAVKVLKQMDAARKKCETDRKRLETVEKEEQRLKESLRNLEEKKKQYQAELEDIKNAEVLYEEWKAYQSKIEELEAEADELEGYKTKVQDCNSRYEEAKKLYKRSDEEYNVKKKHYDECEQAFMDNQAGVFVRRLVDGKPCPICGSLEHPAPYKCEEKHNVVSEDTLNEMKQALDSLRQKRETDNTEAHIAKERLEQTEKAMQDSFDKLVKRIE
ncbi:MAG: AAA family ATPase, partial [Coprococcus sp.]